MIKSNLLSYTCEDILLHFLREIGGYWDEESAVRPIMRILITPDRVQRAVAGLAFLG